MDSHATMNMLKWRQNFVDGRLGTTIIGFNSLNSIEVDFLNPTLRLATPPSSSIRPFERPMIK